MKTSIKTILGAAAVALCAVPAVAQNTYSGYFLDNYDYRFQMNPAFGNDKGFVSFPVLGNFNTAIRGTMHVSDFVYVRDGKTVLFTNPKVSEAEAMGNFEDRNRLGTDWKIGIMSAGFKAFGGYNTISINADLGVHASVPKMFFQFAKEGLANKTYEISNLGAYAYGYGEISLGHSRDIKQVPGLRVGANLKFLVGLANFQADFKNANLELGTDSWRIHSNADIYGNVGGLEIKSKPQEYTENGETKYYNAYDGISLSDGPGNLGPNGFGMAVDLGASYQWNDFTFSLAALDLGGITYKNTQHATTGGVQTFDTDKFSFSADGDADNSFSKAWDNMREDIEKLYRLDVKGNVGSRYFGLGTTLNVGVDYALPVYRKLHFGLLSSTRIQGDWTWTQVRLSANVAPVKVLSADVNVSAGTYGWGFGWLFNLHLTGFNLFFGMDHTLGTMAAYNDLPMIPLNSNASFNFGLNFPF